MDNRKIVFVTFADSKFKESLAIVGKQAAEMNIFDKIYLFRESDLDKNFRKYLKPWLHLRGYGYWRWKPYFCHKVMSQLNDDDIIVYGDVATAFNPNGIRRLKEYLDLVDSSESGILVFEDYFKEHLYNKIDNLAFFEVDKNSEIIDSEQILAGLWMMRKTPISAALIDEWCNLAKNNEDLFTDVKSKRTELPEFIEHRHDQSVFSILVKLRPHVALPISERQESNYPNIPFQPRVNKFMTQTSRLKGRLLLPWRFVSGYYLKWCKGFHFYKSAVWW